ncbi:MAG: hypothetical protein WCW02_03570 [Candidatus Buchananbacteria bacterium]
MLQQIGIILILIAVIGPGYTFKTSLPKKEKLMKKIIIINLCVLCCGLILLFFWSILNFASTELAIITNQTPVCLWNAN